MELSIHSKNVIGKTVLILRHFIFIFFILNNFFLNFIESTDFFFTVTLNSTSIIALVLPDEIFCQMFTRSYLY